MKTRVFAVCAIFFLFCGVAQADSEKLLNPNNGHQYQRFDTGLFWSDAKTACKNLGAHLATISNQSENDWVNNLANGAWIGGTDEDQEGSWKWITGEPWSYTNWRAGEPNNVGGNEDYIQIHNGVWIDLSNGWSLTYVCEWESSQPPVVTKPYTFTAGTPAKATEINADLDILYQQINVLKTIVCADHPTANGCQ